VNEHREHLLFYLHHSPLNLMPWLFLAAAALVPSRQGRGAGPGLFNRNPAQLFLAIIVVVDVAFLSASGMRRAVYFLPLAPVIFLAMGLWLERRIRAVETGHGGRDRLLLWLVGGTGLLIFLGVGIAPLVYVGHYGLSWKLAALSTALVAAAAIMAAGRLYRGDHRGVMDHALGIWIVGLVFMNLVLPPLRDPRMRMADRAFWAARERIQSVGAEVWESGLPESDLGLASLIIRQPLRTVKTIGEIKALLAQDRPVVVLTPPSAMLDDPGLAQVGCTVRPEVPVHGTQGTGLCLILNAKAVRGFQRPEMAGRCTGATPAGALKSQPPSNTL
jgi:hypothetical protein